MNEALFLAGAATMFSLFIWLGWRWLPGDRFQVLASVPVARQEATRWQGVNFTWYGVLTASAATVAILYVLILAVAAGASLAAALAALALTVGLCVPASRLVARLVEKKQYTFTIGGAFFIGLTALPLIVLAVNGVCGLRRTPPLDMQMLLAATAIGYLLGEGLGRMACVSFGCCYGKPLNQCGRIAGLVFDRLAFVFTGTTKKAVYEGNLAGVKLFPVQGVTCVVSTATALLATHLFLLARFRSAFLLCLVVSQAWRVFSETLRADFRGFTAITAYQKMAMAAMVYGALISLCLPDSPHGLPMIGRGLLLTCNPFLILGLQALWIALFIIFGRSMVTQATLAFEVRRDRI